MVALPTRWWLYPQDAYKMATVPRFCEFYHKMEVCLQDGDVTNKMATMQFCLQDGCVSGSLPTRWRRYQQDGGFTHKMPTRWRQCRVSASFTHKIAAWEFFSYKMSTLPTRWRRYQQDGTFTHKMPTKWRLCRVSASFTHKMAACIQDSGVANKTVALPTRCLQDGDSAVFLRVLPTR